MLPKLIYLKSKLDKEGKIDLNNIVNLKKPILFNKKFDSNVKQYYTPENNEDTTLVFESRFECGNLLCAFKMDDTNGNQIAKYQLILQNDTNTTGYIQWFFFRITNTKKNKKVSLSIINMVRKTSLYSSGLKIWCYSEKKAEKDNIGWFRAGENVTYCSNNMYVFNRSRRRGLYTLNFDYEFEYDDDTIYFANSLPYLYSELMKELGNFQLEENKYPYFHRKTLCSTLGGNELDMFSINGLQDHHHNSHYSDNRKGIVLIARQHPGETCSSFVMKGAIDFLLGHSDEAIKLRELYLIKIVPMVNVDGVIIGNSRTSFAGCDLNRRWASPSNIIHPEIFHTKEMIIKMASQREISFVCDFHGHIGAFNSFFYCNHKENPRSCSLFPFICSKTSKIISFLQSNFNMPRYKNGTGRISLFRELDLNNIITLETSFFGSNRMGDYNHVYFNSQILKEIGRDVCLGMLAYYYKYENKSIEKNISLNEIDMHEFENEIIKEKQEEDRDESSDSEPSIDNFDRDRIMSLLPTKNKYRKKNRKKSKSSLMKSLIQFSSKRINKVSDNVNNTNNDIKLPKPFQATSANKLPVTIKDSRSKSLPKFLPANRKTRFSPNISRYVEKKEKILDTIRPFPPIRKDQETQTEDIFFKKSWKYFANKYKIIEPKSSIQNISKKLLETMIDRNIINNNSYSNNGKYQILNQGSLFQVSPYQNQFLYRYQFKNN